MGPSEEAAGEPGKDSTAYKPAFARSASWTILGVLVATMISFAGATLYSHHIASRIDSDAVSIANDASPSIEYLSAARREILHIVVAGTTAIQRYEEGAPLDRAPFDAAIARLHEQLSAYLALPFYPHEHDPYAEVERGTRALEAEVATLLARLGAHDVGGAVTTLRLGIPSAASRVDSAIERLIVFDVAQQHGLGIEIPLLRRHAARVGAILDGVAAVFALILMGLVLRGIRRYARLQELAQRSTEERAKAVAAFSVRLESIARSSVVIAETIRSSTDLQKVFQTTADKARTLVDADFSALGCGTDAARRFDPWVYSGVSPTDAEAIGAPAPRPVGVLGAVMREGHSIRTEDVTRHPAFGQLPAHHPAMGPFIGVPVVHDGRNVGNLYLARRENRPPFSEDDERIIELLAAYAGVAIDNARLYVQAHAATRAREDLLATVSHDLKNPLNVIAMATSMLQKKHPGDARELVARIDRASARMMRLIANLLDAAKIEAGQLRTMPRPEEVASLTQEVMEAFKLAATEKTLQLTSRTSFVTLVALCERDGIQRVLSNLVGNAVKFTPAGGSISVAAEELDGQIRFSVADTGPGIPVELLPHVFDRYWQQKGSDRRGSGLGLYIAKGIVEAHGGRIWVDSVPGRGTVFQFTLPITPIAADAASPPTA